MRRLTYSPISAFSAVLEAFFSILVSEQLQRTYRRHWEPKPAKRGARSHDKVFPACSEWACCHVGEHSCYHAIVELVCDDSSVWLKGMNSRCKTLQMSKKTTSLLSSAVLTWCTLSGHGGWHPTVQIAVWCLWCSYRHALITGDDHDDDIKFAVLGTEFDVYSGFSSMANSHMCTHAWPTNASVTQMLMMFKWCNFENLFMKGAAYNSYMDIAVQRSVCVQQKQCLRFLLHLGNDVIYDICKLSLGDELKTSRVCRVMRRL